MVDMNIENARHNMIEQQIRPWEVLDQGVLDLVLRTPREEFVPPRYRSLAFTDMEIPLGHEQTTMCPKLEARLLQALKVNPGETALEVGTGSGYLTALLAGVAQHVYSVDIHADFIEEARQRLIRHGFDNVTLEVGDAAHGWDEHGPYDVIAITGSLPELGMKFKNSLKVGGRLFVVVGQAPAMQALLITRRNATTWHTESLFETVLAPLVNAPRSETFVF